MKRVCNFGLLLTLYAVLLLIAVFAFAHGNYVAPATMTFWAGVFLPRWMEAFDVGT